MNITQFINSKNEIWTPVPRTWLEVSSYGRLRNTKTAELFGHVLFQDDLGGVIDGTIPIWRKDAVEMTAKPNNYFNFRNAAERDASKYNEVPVEFYDLAAA